MKKQFTLALWSLAALSGMASAQDTDPAHEDFVAADINGDGSLSFEEFQEHGRKPIGRLDTNDDGLVSLEEFLDRRPVAPRRGRFDTRDNRPPPGSAEASDRRAIATEQAESRFTEMDLSGDGYLSAFEMDTAEFTGSRDSRRPAQRWTRTPSGGTIWSALNSARSSNSDTP